VVPEPSEPKPLRAKELNRPAKSALEATSWGFGSWQVGRFFWVAKRQVWQSIPIIMGTIGHPIAPRKQMAMHDPWWSMTLLDPWIFWGFWWALAGTQAEGCLDMRGLPWGVHFTLMKAQRTKHFSFGKPWYVINPEGSWAALRHRCRHVGPNKKTRWDIPCPNPTWSVWQR
jgi:hypothetical protein